MKPHGTAIFVVARRTVGGSELKLDRFLVTVMRDLGCVCIKVEKRKISKKMTPFIIYVKGNSKKRKKEEQWRVSTMREEYILFFKKRRCYATWPRTVGRGLFSPTAQNRVTKKQTGTSGVRLRPLRCPQQN
jgi:hypothetical protein